MCDYIKDYERNKEKREKEGALIIEQTESNLLQTILNGNESDKRSSTML